MSVKVAINGFGRIGRLAFRQMFGAEGYEVVAINDLTSPKMLAHLLKYDSTQGNYAAQGHVVEAGEDNIVVDGKKITIYAKANAAELPWGELGVDVVLECTGFYTSKAKAQAHIDAGAKKVVISAPAGNDLPTIVYNVNHETLTKEEINAAMKAAQTESYGYTEDEIVSSDIVGMTFGSLFDATQTMVNKLPDGKTQVQVVSWYDNENSYVSQMCRTIKHFANLL